MAASLIVSEYIGSEPDRVRMDGSESDSVRISIGSESAGVRIDRQ